MAYDVVAYDLCGGIVAYGMVACGATLVAVPVASLAWVAPATPPLTVLITACAATTWNCRTYKQLQY